MSKDALSVVLPELAESVRDITLHEALEIVRIVVKANTPMSLEAALIVNQIETALESAA